MLEFKRPFVAIRKDPHWVRKILLAAAINFIPYLGAFVVIGWGQEYLRRVAWGDDEHLPEWTPFEPHLMRGLYAFVGMLPLSAVLSIVVLPLSFAMSGAMVVVPLAGEAGWWLFIAILVLFMTLMMGAGFAIAPLTFSIHAQIALFDRLEAAFQYREMWDRLQRSGPTMRRAWWYVIEVGMLLTVPLVLSIALPMTAMPALLNSGTQNAWGLVWLLLASIVSGVLYLAALLISPITSLAGYHYWGTWAREAYGLAASAPDAAGEPAAGADTVAQVTVPQTDVP